MKTIRRRSREVCLELLLLVTHPFAGLFFSYLYKMTTKNSDQGGKKQKKVIVIVKSWLNNTAIHLYWKKYLEKKDFMVYIVHFPLQKGSFDDKAKKLVSFMSSKGIKNATMVGVSSGSITAYNYLQRFSGWKRVNNFIALGAPFKGSPFAVVVSPWKSGRQMFPKSKFLQELFKEKPKNVKNITCITALRDELVPVNRSVIPGSNKVTIDVWGHDVFHLITKKTYDAIIEQI